jgi:hypothetical protein
VFRVHVLGDGTKKTYWVSFHLTVLGKNPLRNLNASFCRATQHNGGGASGTSIYEEHFETFTGTGMTASPPLQKLTGKSALFFGWFSALNGHWEQTVKLQRVGEQWEWRSVIHRDIPTKDGSKRIEVLSDEASPNFPPSERQRPVFPFNCRRCNRITPQLISNV